MSPEDAPTRVISGVISARELQKNSHAAEASLHGAGMKPWLLALTLRKQVQISIHPGAAPASQPGLGKLGIWQHSS